VSDKSRTNAAIKWTSVTGDSQSAVVRSATPAEIAMFRRACDAQTVQDPRRGHVAMLLGFLLSEPSCEPWTGVEVGLDYVPPDRNVYCNVDLVPPSNEQLESASERIADLVARLWCRGLVTCAVGDTLDDGGGDSSCPDVPKVIES
jgi:hypothetical protein